MAARAAGPAILWLGVALGAAVPTMPPALAQTAERPILQRLPAGRQEILPPGIPFVVRFAGSLQGLGVGAPVQVRGIQVGTVREVTVVIDSAAAAVDVPVVIDIVPDRMVVDGRRPDTPEAAYELADRLVRRGLRAGLVSSSLLTGELTVALVWRSDAAPVGLGRGLRYPEIPAVPAAADVSRADLATRGERLAADLEATLAALRSLATAPELAQAAQDLTQGLAALRGLAESLDESARPALRDLAAAAALARELAEEASRSIGTLDGTVGAGSPLWADLIELVRELRDATRSLRLVLDYLERHPDALIRGRAGPS